MGTRGHKSSPAGSKGRPAAVAPPPANRRGVPAPPGQAGQVVLDVRCGTGLYCCLLRETWESMAGSPNGPVSQCLHRGYVSLTCLAGPARVRCMKIIINRQGVILNCLRW